VPNIGRRVGPGSLFSRLAISVFFLLVVSRKSNDEMTRAAASRIVTGSMGTDVWKETQFMVQTVQPTFLNLMEGTTMCYKKNWNNLYVKHNFRFHIMCGYKFRHSVIIRPCYIASHKMPRIYWDPSIFTLIKRWLLSCRLYR
jgi:hypothetical protein